MHRRIRVALAAGAPVGHRLERRGEQWFVDEVAEADHVGDDAVAIHLLERRLDLRVGRVVLAIRDQHVEIQGLVGARIWRVWLRAGLLVSREVLDDGLQAEVGVRPRSDARLRRHTEVAARHVAYGRGLEMRRIDRAVLEGPHDRRKRVRIHAPGRLTGNHRVERPRDVAVVARAVVDGALGLAGAAEHGQTEVSEHVDLQARNGGDRVGEDAVVPGERVADLVPAAHPLRRMGAADVEHRG